MEFVILGKNEDIISVKIKGEVAAEHRDYLSEKFYSLLENLKKDNIKKILVHMEDVEYIDSIGISLFVKLKKDLNKMNMGFEFINVSKIIKKIFSLLSLDNYFDFSEKQGE